jgi:hypothetical protein
MTRIVYSAPLACVLLTAIAGCPAVVDLPAELEVATSAAVKHPAARDSGPPSLANSTWAAFRAVVEGESDEPPADPPPGPYGGLLDGSGLARPPAGAQIFKVAFGANGVPVRITDNEYFLKDIYGAEVPVGGEWEQTVLPGVEYRSAGYGLEVGGRFGVAILVQVRVGTTFIGQAILYTWGTLSEDRLEGIFGYAFNFDEGIGGLVLQNTGDQYAFFATRVE